MCNLYLNIPAVSTTDGEMPINKTNVYIKLNFAIIAFWLYILPSVKKRGCIESGMKEGSENQNL